jgi:hypothetical protein
MIKYDAIEAGLSMYFTGKLGFIQSKEDFIKIFSMVENFQRIVFSFIVSKPGRKQKTT